MRISRIRLWLLPMALVCAILNAEVIGSGSISGVARDGDGKPLAGVNVTLTGVQTPHTTYHITSGPLGEYRLASLGDGKYTLVADFSGYAATAPIVIRLQPASESVTANLTLVRSMFSPSASLLNAGVATSPTTAPSRPPLEFQASGVRGLIDPGGYSASTQSSATGLLRGIADLKRTDKTFATSSAKDWPCGLEPELRKAVAEHQDQFEANRRLGEFYASHDQPAKAIPLLKRASEIDATSYAAARELAIAWLESNQFESVRSLLTPFVNRQDKPEVHQLLARADEGSGLFQQAAQEYRKAEIQDPSEESLFGVGYELILAGSASDASAAFEAGLKEHPQSIPLHIGAGTSHFLQGKTSEALQNFLEATDIDPADPRPYSFLVAMSGISGDESERVRNSLKRFLDRKPDSGAANYFYAVALRRQGAAVNAAQIEILLKRAIQLDPNIAKAHLQLADIYARRNDYDAAVPEYEAAVRLGENSEAHYRLALAYKRTGHLDLSAREMQIFNLSKERPVAASDGIDLAQFISVMDAPNSHAREEVQCPATPR